MFICIFDVIRFCESNMNLICGNERCRGKSHLPNLLILKPGGEDFVAVEDVAAVKKQGRAH